MIPLSRSRPAGAVAVPQPGTGARGVDGVNVIGYLRTESGIGSLGRSYVRALRSLRVPVSLLDVSDLSGNRAGDRTLTSFDTRHPHKINLVCGDIDLHHAMVARLGDGAYKHSYNIGVWAWELPRFPEKWYDRFVYYDEIWAGTSFIANTLSPVSPVPVVRIPPVLVPEARGSREAGRRRLGAAPGESVYLFIFDFHSGFQRKNPLAVVDAFRAAFAPSAPVRLVIKCVNPGFDREHFAALQARAQGYPVSIHAGYWPAEEMRDLMAACDAYVSLHRSEGIGLTVTDAMALGKPVIATGWSGNMDFMSVANSFPVRYELVQLGERAGHYQAGETWAEPSVDHAAELMRQAFEGRAEAEARGRVARRDIEADYSEAKVARLLEHRLTLINSRRRFSALKQALKGPVSDLDSFLAEFQDISRFVPGNRLHYQRLLGQVQEAVPRAVPPGATVLVVSRGDDELLRLDGRRGWHFPQTEAGVYAGHNPADSAEAIAHLEELRARGAQFLLFPATGLWWLDHYREFREHLERRYRVVLGQKEVCVIFALASDPSPGGDGGVSAATGRG
jgi:glycosyltransferase involved in cell wall biosynthesis